MSRESEPDQPGQRTVADLLAQYGGQQRSGPRRRRRRAEDDDEAAPQQIIDRVLSESGRLRPIKDDAAIQPPATPPSASAPSTSPTIPSTPPPTGARPAADPPPSSPPSSAAQERAAASSADAPTGYFEPPTAYVQVPAAPDPGGRTGTRRTSHEHPEPADFADEPTGFLDPVRLAPPSGPDHPDVPPRPSGRPERPTGRREHPAGEQPPYPLEPPTEPRPGAADRPTGYRPAPDSVAHPGTPEPSGRPGPDPLTDTGRLRYGAAAADAARAGRTAARASWPVGGLAKPIREPVAESRTEQLPRISAGLEGTELVQPVGHPDAAEESATPDNWYALDDDSEHPEPRPAVATNLMVPLPAPDHTADPHAADDHGVDQHGLDQGADHFGADQFAAEQSADRADTEHGRQSFAGTDVDADESSAGEPEADEPARSGSPVRQWTVLIAQLLGGVVGGAVLWLGFQLLWQKLPIAALGLAVVVTVGLVLVVRMIRKVRDVQTTVLAVLVGLVVTATPAAFLLVGQ